MCARPTYGSRGRILVDVFFRLSHQARVQTEAPGGTAASLQSAHVQTHAMGGDAVFSNFRGKCFSRKLDFFLFNMNIQLILGARGFRMARCGPLVAPLLPPCGPLWPAVARLWPLVAPLFSTGEPLKNFRVARCAGHRATGPPEIFQRFGFLVFFSFFGRRSTRRRKERIILSLLFLYRRPSAEK